MSSVYELVLLLLFCGLLPLVLAAGNQAECPPSFPCGYLSNISFPFTLTERPDCGLLPISNCDDPLKPIMIQLHKIGLWFQLLRVAQLFSSPTTPLTSFQFRDKNLYDLLQNESCEAFRNNYTLPFPHSFHFASFHFQYNTTLFRCNRSLHVSPPTNMHNYTKCPDYDLYYNNNPKAEDASLRACTKVLLPIKDAPDANNPFTFATADIFTKVELTDECAACHYRRGGQCQLDSREIFFCATANSIAVTIALLLVMVKIYHTRWKKQNPTNQQIRIFLEREGPLQTKRYDYSEIKKVTNSFRNKLGQGGFGSVYKGKLPDGRYVAVKILCELKDNGEDFINEVATISRTSHINIVNLLGFCSEGSKRALVYEFMSNGSLEKFIFEENVIKTDRQLDCQTIYHIAIGVARGLEYLHQGCNTRILHFDIKPHNILLDENFNPKISDFGLAKICTRKESMISIFGARGTAGYIAPEVFSRNFGTVSHKSDVYSYGMMILEMVGRRKNIKTEVNCSSEIYFPDWIYNRLESNEELGLQNIRNESDDKLVRKMTIVGLWCIQTHPSTRPAISKVLEMLGSKVELLQIPPKPFLSSPPTSPVHLSCETL
ncbi:LEAF RUST 10 DISEASE-RESISTANCE LOCUS RECEPTOR-LIKE PROTEIN KINASE-like 2.4 isoform X2 [Glycine soja]|uniref:non-specific serine/threonine protein kinase n=1 Tax=Glycine soja TaxID=3848 RepID=A0A445F3X4_GLYSO|nr:LEAF RUST 10 DISEASE-RESISTANCE LOCUS RECEPTOR-LIKE PROTEIN KINASE-like 2.4 isoform X2 [Glycine soja]RZB43484.1 LEAF RUST 10 DISEASE-RESISTANCE LOCUS RECEPTOR-LIKE PROTEIN KINASE-like 2.5 isoform B [Glycine soja]